MSIYDPIYGELYTSKEVSEITGFTSTQLRNQRSRPETSIMPFVSDGNSSWYRKTDVEAYVDKFGMRTLDYVVPKGMKAAPLEGNMEDAARRNDIKKMRTITTRNSWTKWATYVTEESGIPAADAYQRIEEEQTRLYKLSTGDDLSLLYPSPLEFAQMRKQDPFRFWPSYTYAIRRIASDVMNLDVTDREIVDAPVGDVPPTKMD